MIITLILKKLGNNNLVTTIVEKLSKQFGLKKIDLLNPKQLKITNCARYNKNYSIFKEYKRMRSIHLRIINHHKS